MAIRPMLTYALVMSLMVLETKSESCEKGWFGSNCAFQCQCYRSEICGRNGECPNFGRCATGYFGPACQYIDLVSKHGAASNQDFYSDSNDSTCNANSNASLVVVDFVRPIPFMWIRVVVRQERYLRDLVVSINGNSKCQNERRFQVNQKVVDITCDNYESVLQIMFTGPGAAHVCSIYVSGGRNVALKQNTAQVPPTGGDINRPSNAVDGNTDNVYAKGSCSYTRNNSDPQWSIRFSKSKIVLSVTVYYRDFSGLMIQPGGFKLETFDISGNKTNFLENNATGTLPIYTLELESFEPIISATIIGEKEVLSLCEVQFFGDTLCPEGSYGLNCELSCSCSSGEMCSIATGLCAPGCPLGMYGSFCARQCPSMCYETTCSPRDGSCSGCFPGFMGAHCEKPCDQGTYGHQCNTNCSEHCLDPCNNQNGACKCTEGFSGLDCKGKECSSGLFGVDCTQKCSDNCHHSECLQDSGECIKCVGFREGKFCEDCPAKSFGKFCQKKCSEFCVNETCDRETGNCPICTNNYQGAQCALYPETEFSRYWLFALAAPILVIISVITLFFYTRKKSFQIDEDEEQG